MMQTRLRPSSKKCGNSLEGGGQDAAQKMASRPVR
jgi:hypothetical protein